MRKIITCAIVTIALFSCTKEKSEVKTATPITIQFRAEAISLDNTIQYSNISTVTL